MNQYETYDRHPSTEKKLLSRNLGLKGRYATQWIRFKEYDIKSTASGKAYLAPKENAAFEMYDPFNEAESLLVDILRLGDAYRRYCEVEKEIHINAYRKRKHQKLWDELQESLLEWAKRYGLLGFMSSSTYNHNIIGEKTILLTEKNFLGTQARTMEETAYIGLFTPFAEAGAFEVQTYKDKAYLVKYEDSPKFYGKRSMVLDLVFSSFYSEDILWPLEYAKMLCTHFDQLQTFKKSAGSLTEPVTIMADRFQAGKIGFTIIQGTHTQIAWEFDSLMTAIQTIYGFALTEGSVELKRCQHCNGFFFAGTARERYCGDACRNRHNVMRTRERDKNENTPIER